MQLVIYFVAQNHFNQDHCLVDVKILGSSSSEWITSHSNNCDTEFRLQFVALSICRVFLSIPKEEIVSEQMLSSFKCNWVSDLNAKKSIFNLFGTIWLDPILSWKEQWARCKMSEFQLCKADSLLKGWRNTFGKNLTFFLTERKVYKNI